MKEKPNKKAREKKELYFPLTGKLYIPPDFKLPKGFKEGGVDKFYLPKNKEEMAGLSGSGEIIEGECFSGPGITHDFDNIKRMIKKYGKEEAIKKYIELGIGALKEEEIRRFFDKALTIKEEEEV